MSELVWKEIHQLQKQVEFLIKDQKAQTRINAELIKQLSTAKGGDEDETNVSMVTNLR